MSVTKFIHKRLGWFLLAIIFWPMSVSAHPHIFVNYSVEQLRADAGFANLHFTFKINGDANPLLSPTAMAGDMPVLQKDMLANLNQHPFFLYLTIDGRAGPPQKIEPVITNNAKGETAYSYDLTLPDRLDNFSFALYDESYFDTVQLAGQPQLHIGNLPCAVENRIVAKTVWGPVTAQFVNCGKVPQAAMPLLQKQPPGDMSGGSAAPAGRGFLP